MDHAHKTFSLPVINWLLTIVAGGVVPVVSQNIIAVAISSLNPTPAMEGVLQYPVLFSIFVLIGFGLVFVSVFVYQIWFIVKLQTHSSVWALIVFLMLPVSVWGTIFLISGV